MIWYINPLISSPFSSTTDLSVYEKRIVRERVTEQTSFQYQYSGIKLSELIEVFQKYPENAVLMPEWDYEDLAIYIEWDRPETDEEYNKRIEAYNRTLATKARKEAEKREKRYKEYLKLKGEFEKWIISKFPLP